MRRSAATAAALQPLSSIFGGDAVCLASDESRRGVVQRVAELSDSEDDYSDEDEQEAR